MSFDYIIVGAGSAGCVLANRLSEDPSCNVLLLEAGGKDPFHASMPGMYALLHRSRVDWAFWSEPQPHVENRRLFIPRGKVLGGCSTTNAMAYVRGNAVDYDEWERLGNTGWGFDEVLPYFKKSEHHDVFGGGYHGKNGPLHVGFAQHPSRLSKIFVDACVERGIPFNEDYNGANQFGASMLQFTIKNNRRQSTSKAFLQPVISRKNLTIKTNASVNRVVFKGNRAVGVEVAIGKSTSEVITCAKEVIISAGSIKSPQLLMLSGIGDKSSLAAHHIEAQVDLPGVGRNLQDHVWTHTGNLTTIPTSNSDIKPWNMLKSAGEYFLMNKGAFTNSPIEANAFIKTKGSERPDIQYHFAPFYIGDDYKTDIYNFTTLPRKDGFSILVILLHPRSRGELSLKSSNPADPPAIDPHFLEHEEDVASLVKGLRKAMDVADASAFRPLSKNGLHHPPKNASDEALISHIRKSLETLYHPVGTCKMGVDEMAVVDHKLRVRGVENLRVIDASVMPTIVSGNTNAPSIMIGEKGADLVKQVL